MENQFYIKQINCVMDFIEEHLNERLLLTTLAKKAGISKYYFHRIFKAVTGETLNNYIKRRRMETACRKVMKEPDRSLTEIAFDSGYNSSANFTRDFTDFYQKSPSKTRTGRKSPTEREVKLRGDLEYSYNGIKIIPEMKIVYSRVLNGYNPETIKKSFDALFQFALAQGLFRSPEQFIGIGYDDPDYTPLAKCRYDACLVLPEDMQAIESSLFNSKVIKQGQYAVFTFEGKGEEFFGVWDLILKEWLLNSSYIPENRPHLEMYLPCSRYLEGYFKANLCLPVKKQV